jgi:hypothetical protein
MIWSLVAVASAQQTCEKTSLGKLAALPTPGVFVLGERKGTLPDLARARKLVLKLLKRGPVTVAVQAIRREHQAELDAYTSGSVLVGALPATLDWENTWGFPFEAYVPLLETSADGAKLVAIGQDYALRPQDAELTVPPGYIHVLADGMGDSPVPAELESTLAQTVAWADHRFAAAAIEAWDGQGALVIVVDRYHVEGGMGVQWQARTLTDKGVEAAILANADSRCYPGDKLLP